MKLKAVLLNYVVHLARMLKATPIPPEGNTVPR